MTIVIAKRKIVNKDTFFKNYVWEDENYNTEKYGGYIDDRY